MRFENLFDLEEAKKTNILVSGANASGKTLLSCGIASMLHRLGYRVLVFDISGAWKRISNLPYYSKVYDFDGEKAFPKLTTSGIYDLSTLKVSETKPIVEEVLNEIWNKRITQNYSFLKPMWLIFEESEAYLKYIRGSASEEVYRMVHVGRNIKTRSVLITTDLALLDTSVIRLCGIRFHGFLHIEENSKRKFKSYYGKDFQRIASEGLDSGDFIRLHKRKVDIISVQEFHSRTTPELYLTFERDAQNTEPQQTQLSLTQKLKNLFS